MEKKNALACTARVNGDKLKVGAMQDEKDGKGLDRDFLGQGSRAIHAHCVRGGWLEMLPKADLLNCLCSTGPSQQNCYALLLHRKLECVPLKCTAACVLLVICLFPNSPVCCAAPWYKVSKVNQCKIKKGGKKKELIELFPCVLTCIAIYICLS